MSYWINPLQDVRWDALAEKHPSASIFHTSGWLSALKRTYGFNPVAFTSSPPGQELSDGIVFCTVESRFTGRRLVSLPFTDHCQPLVNGLDEFGVQLRKLLEATSGERWKYIQLRPLDLSYCNIQMPPQWLQSEIFHIHKLDMAPDLAQLFNGFHKNSIQSMIRRAEREQLVYESGRSRSLIEKFFHLMVKTRRRHKLPPQPIEWFKNLADCLGDAMTIRIASKGDLPIASILTLACKKTVVYKYSCSDEQYHNLGGMHLLLWKTIQEAKERGMLELDMGRTDIDQPGLVLFKERWGAKKSGLAYIQCPPESCLKNNRLGGKAAREIFAYLPDWMLIAAGKWLYPHIG